MYKTDLAKKMIHNLIVLWDEKLKKANLKQLLLAEFDQRCLINQSHWCQQSLIRVSGTWLRHDGGRRITWKMPHHYGQHYVPLCTTMDTTMYHYVVCTTLYQYGQHYGQHCVPLCTTMDTSMYHYIVCTTLYHYGQHSVPLCVSAKLSSTMLY